MSPLARRAALAATLALIAPALLAAGPPANGPASDNAKAPSHVPAFVQVGVDASEWSSDTALDPVTGIYPIGGGGQLNGEFVIAERGQVQIGLRITDRTHGVLEAQGDYGTGTYAASTGFDTGTTGPAEWNYDWHVDLRGSNTTLADYDLTLDTDIADPLFGDATPIDLKFPEVFGDALDNGVLYQSSQNPTFGNDTFDPTVEGTYEFSLTLTPKHGGRSLSVTAVVNITHP